MKIFDLMGRALDYVFTAVEKGENWSRAKEPLWGWFPWRKVAFATLMTVCLMLFVFLLVVPLFYFVLFKLSAMGALIILFALIIRAVYKDIYKD